ncbi:unnamed protein product [Zymoseptoria tritici ST99CH_3D1]|nr:unnamed protein product [Zymoseptoria tritici ST99CH_3D1]
MHIASFLPALWIGEDFDRARHALVGRPADLTKQCLEAHGCCYDSHERDSDPEYYICQAGKQGTGCNAKHNACNPNRQGSGYATC